MHRSAAMSASPAAVAEKVAELFAAAADFVVPDRAMPLLRKWLRPGAGDDLSDEQAMLRAGEAALLAADLLPSQPSASGATAFDRLARSRAGGDPVEKAAIEALQQARFRLLRTEPGGSVGNLPLRDVVSGGMLRLIDPEFPRLPAGAALFARTVLLGEGACTLAGAVTPLDDAAFAVASAHPGRRTPGAAAAARWAEAVYAHVCRHGTLEMPGLNRPPADWDEEPPDPETAALMELTLAWTVLGADAPDAALLQRTREFASLPTILSALGALAAARQGRHEEVGGPLERILLVLLETAQNRGAIGAGAVTLDVVARALDEGIAAKRLPPGSRAVFDALRRRLGNGAGRRDDPELERLLQRIRALRAKTVEQGCTEAEALAAAEKVAELLDRYGLSLGELEWREQPCEGIGIQTGRKRFAAIDNCVPAIAAYFDCRVWVEQAKGAALRYVFFGLRGDVAAAEYLYEMVERAFDTETQAFRAGPLYAAMQRERRSATTSFQTGLAHGIADKLHAMRSAREAAQRGASGRDLVPLKAAVVDEELAKLGLTLQGRSVGGRKRVLSDAFDAGREAGERFEVTPGIARAA